MKYSKFTFFLSPFKYTIIAWLMVLASCNSSNKTPTTAAATTTPQFPSSTDIVLESRENTPVPAADLIGKWVYDLRDQRVAIVGNQTSVVQSADTIKSDNWKKPNKLRYTHLVDTLLSYNVDIKRVFAPEHGFRGTADAGASVSDGVDQKTGLSIISLYGDNKKPTREQLEDVDVILFDVQDVGARFYTYISTLHYVMEAAAQYGKKVIVLDRPNPNGHYIDGPILEKEHQSFVGMHPVPVVHGMTIGEYAQMINGERWLTQQRRAELEVIKAENYTHQTPYSIPILPSPNLPNDQAINLYPSLCFFEGTEVSVGRGTDMQFQVYGSPSLVRYEGFAFTPTPNPGAKRPKFNGKRCYGVDLRSHPKLDRIKLAFLVDAFAKAPSKENFFNPFFTKLAGTTRLQEQIEQGMSAAEITASWEGGLEEFKKTRRKYLLYD